MNALELKDIRKSYNGRVVLDVPSLAVKHGDRVALVGPNGCGKTTLLRIAALLLSPDRGEVVIQGKRVNRHFPGAIHSNIAFMAQEPFFFRGSLTGNMDFALSSLRLSPKQRRERIAAYLSRLGIEGLGERSPRTFSTGEKKRAAIARALVRETPMLLLDEPFTHIDNASAAVLEKVIDGLSRDRTVVFSTHDLSHAYRLADSVVSLQNGSISPSTLENMFSVNVASIEDGAELRTPGGLVIYSPENLKDGAGCTISINPREVLVSRDTIESSARNSFQGAITRIESAGPRTVVVTADCPPDLPIRAMLTERTMRELGLSVGDEIWVHFKSAAVQVLDEA